VITPEDFTARPAEDEIYHRKAERPLATLINGLADDLQRLFRLEIALFKCEIGDNARRLSIGVVLLAVGAALAFTAWLAVFAAAVIALTIVWPAWLAAVAIGVATSIPAGLLLFFGVRSVRTQRLMPQRTLKSLRENGAWVKERVS
jgi:hypothetical protein